MTPLGLLHPVLKLHFFRYLLVYPILYLSDTLSLQHQLGFGLTVCVMFHYTCRNLLKTSQEIVGKTLSANNVLLIVVPTLALFLSMNGRISFAFLGFSVIFFTIVKQKKSPIKFFNLISKISFGLLLTSVSTGAMSLSVIFLLGVAFGTLKSTFKKNGIWKRDLGLRLANPLILLAFFPLFVMSINKNLEFFGSGIQSLINMTSHGLGLYLGLDALSPNALIICLVILTPPTLFALLLANYRGLPLPIFGLFVTICCGLFGLSTLTLAYIPLVTILITRSLYFRI